jgi:uncharacterized protein YegP (UPF0339 family)
MSDITPEVETGFDARAIYDQAAAEVDPDPLRSVIFQALGAASACWENLAGAGVFESDRAKAIGDDLLDFLREQGVPRDVNENDYAHLYKDNAYEWRYRVFAGNHRQIDKAEEGFASKRNAERAMKRKHPHIKWVTEVEEA